MVCFELESKDRRSCEDTGIFIEIWSTMAFGRYQFAAKEMIFIDVSVSSQYDALEEAIEEFRRIEEIKVLDYETMLVFWSKTPVSTPYFPRSTPTGTFILSFST